MQNIDKVRVNGTEYEITMGGELPIRGYQGSESSVAVFNEGSAYVPDTDVTFARIYPTYYMRRTGLSGSEVYDLVLTYVMPDESSFCPAEILSDGTND